MNNATHPSQRSRAWRSRWAAVGAAVAVTLGGGGLLTVSATSVPSEPSSFVAVDPVRIVDTRTDLGLAGPFVSDESQQLRVTGTIETQTASGAAPIDEIVVPDDATAVAINVAVLRPTTQGFLSIRPGDQSGVPATSNLTWGPTSENISNSITVNVPASGLIDIFVRGSIGDLLIDVEGYFVAAAAGPAGPAGPEGPEGPEGPAGADADANLTFVEVNATMGAVGALEGQVVQCPTGSQAIAGGWGPAPGAKIADVWRSVAVLDGWDFAWTVEPGGSGATLILTVTCL